MRESLAPGRGQDLPLPSPAFLSAPGSCLDAEGQGPPPGPSRPPRMGPQAKLVLPRKAEGASLPAAGQTHSASVCSWSETSLGPILGGIVRFPFIPQFCLPAKPAGPLLLTWACPCPSAVPSRGLRPGGQTGRLGLRTAREALASRGANGREAGPCAREAAGGRGRGSSSLPRALVPLLPGGAGPPLHFPLSLGDP